MDVHLVDEVEEVLRLALIPPLEIRALPAGPRPPKALPPKPPIKPVVV
jgi:hypothetical protein